MVWGSQTCSQGWPSPRASSGSVTWAVGVSALTLDMKCHLLRPEGCVMAAKAGGSSHPQPHWETLPEHRSSPCVLGAAALAAAMHQEHGLLSRQSRNVCPGKGNAAHLERAGPALTSLPSPPQAPAPSPMACQESEYRDEHGKCTPCRKCMPGQELSKVTRLLWNSPEPSGSKAVQCQLDPLPSFRRIFRAAVVLGRAGARWEGTVNRCAHPG